MEISFEMKRFSTARVQIMGWAMLLILFFHSSFPITEASGFYVIKGLCDIGVDIFLFVSGIGIWFSLSRSQSTKAYIKRRCRRILPAFLMVNTLWFSAIDGILVRVPILQYIKDITTISFWVDGNLTTWYLSSLLALQIISPIIRRLIKKDRHFLLRQYLFLSF